MTSMPTQDPTVQNSNGEEEADWFAPRSGETAVNDAPQASDAPQANDAPQVSDAPEANDAPQASEGCTDFDALRDEIREAVRQFQAVSQQTCDALRELREDWGQKDAASDDKLSGLDQKLARVEALAVGAQDEAKALGDGLSRQMDAMRGSIDALTTRNVDVMRQNMEFTNTSARRWTKELEEYRALFRDSAYDSIWKELGEIYINILKHLNRKKDPDLTRELEFCALEPIQELLEENGITIFRTEPGQKRSFRRTKSRSQRPTGDEQLNACVVRSILPGFARGNLCLIPEAVESYIYQEGYVEAPQEEPSPELAPEAAAGAQPDEAPADVQPDAAAEATQPEETRAEEAGAQPDGANEGATEAASEQPDGAAKEGEA